MTWVLIIISWMGSANGGVSVENVPGFGSQEACLEAGHAVHKAIERMYAKARTAPFSVTECVRQTS